LVSVRVPAFSTFAKPVAPEMVRPEMLTVLPEVKNTPPELAPLWLTVSLLAPNPVMVTLASIDNTPLVSAMVCPIKLGEKLMVSPLLACART